MLKISLSYARIINPLTRNAHDNSLHLSRVLTEKKKGSCVKVTLYQSMVKILYAAMNSKNAICNKMR